MREDTFDWLLKNVGKQEEKPLGLARIFKKNWGEEQKFKYLQKHKAKPVVENYIVKLMKNLKIKIYAEDEQPMLEFLKYRGSLAGFCWQTTQSSIPFFEDDACIERGNLILGRDSEKTYFHSWIAFKFKEKDYVFDPCLGFLCSKKLYYKTFAAEKMSSVPAKVVRKSLIEEIQSSQNKPKKERSEFWLYAPKELVRALEEQEHEDVIEGNNDINAPFFRSSVGYKAKIEGEQVKELSAHYYMNI